MHLWAALTLMAAICIMPLQAQAKSGSVMLEGRVLIEHVVAANETLSLILFRYGIGDATRSSYRLYGKRGFVTLIHQLNPKITDWNNLEAGQVLRLEIPKDLVDKLAAGPKASPPPSKGESVASTFIAPKQKSNYHGKQVLPPAEKGRTLTVQLEPGQTVSQQLYRQGIGIPGSPYRIFGEDGWLARTMLLNPQITDWNQIAAGTEITLALPASPEKEASAKNAAVVIEKAPASPPALTAEQKAVLANAKESDINKVMALPADALETIPPQTLAARLDDETVTKLSDEEIKKIPPAVVEEKAWDHSFFSSGKEGVGRLWEKVDLGAPPLGAPPLYIGARYGISLADREDKLASQVRLISFIAELRDGTFEGLRLSYDTAPEVKSVQSGETWKFGYSKLLLGWAFKFRSPFLVDQFHLTPRIGSYSAKIRSPMVLNEIGQKVFEQIEVKRALSTGLEVDAEFTRFFYVLRGWAGADFTLGPLAGKKSARSIRYGLDLFLKGPGFRLLGGRISLAYLIFAANEEIRIKTKHPTLANTDIDLALPHAGLGLTLSW